MNNKKIFPDKETMDSILPYVKRKNDKNIEQMKKDWIQWLRTAWQNKLDYEVTWFWVPIIQNPYDMMLMQELIFKIQPDVIIETWVAHGWSLIYYSSLLHLLWKWKVIWVDIDIRKHNRDYIENHPFFDKITLIEWDSAGTEVIDKIKSLINPDDKVMVLLDSDHRRPHVTRELNAYKDLVSVGSYLVVFDTFMPYLVWLEWVETSNYDDFQNNSAMNAVDDFVEQNKNFEIDEYFHKFIVSSCPKGFLKKNNN